METPRTHAEQLIPRIETTLADARITLEQLDAIAFGRGPGSFIGVRLASAVAQGLAAASGTGLAPVSSMAAMAWQAATARTQDASDELCVIVCLDARMNEVYLAEYVWLNGRLETKTSEVLTQPAAVRLPSGGNWLGVGSGFAAYPQLQARVPPGHGQITADLQPRARELLPFAQAAVRDNALIAPDAWRSEYLRDQDAWQRRQ
jgi:tRNA threonylcarbamoyladenosine biosynthesis protein TsaB